MTSGDDYTRRQAAKDSEYERAYREWVDSMSPEERRELETQGLDQPDVCRHGNGAAMGDLADSPLMSQGGDPALLPEAVEIDAGAVCDSEAVWSAVRRIMGEILTHQNAALTAECISLVSGLSYVGSSETEIAMRHGVTRAAVSKRCVELTERLDLRPSRAMRSLTARDSYRAARNQSTKSHEPNPNTSPEQQD